MAINRKLGYSSQNWDAEPEVVEEVKTSSLPNPGDLISPKRSYSLVPHPKHSGYMFASPLYERQTSNVLQKTNGRHALVLGDVCFTTGIYVGQVRLNDGRKMQTGGHWTSTRQVKGLVIIYHVFMFGQHKVLLELTDIEVLQMMNFDDDVDDDA